MFAFFALTFVTKWSESDTRGGFWGKLINFYLLAIETLIALVRGEKRAGRCLAGSNKVRP
jgi:hypothetical protein